MVLYDAFISYSHAKDKPIAAALQSVVQKLGKPWYRRRALRVFRDDTSLSATPSLWPSIEQALKRGKSMCRRVLSCAKQVLRCWADLTQIHRELLKSGASSDGINEENGGKMDMDPRSRARLPRTQATLHFRTDSGTFQPPENGHSGTRRLGLRPWRGPLPTRRRKPPTPSCLPLTEILARGNQLRYPRQGTSRHR